MKVRVHKSSDSQLESLVKDFDAHFTHPPRVHDWITTRFGTFLVVSVELFSSDSTRDEVGAYVVGRQDPPPSGVLMP